jgi:hypothetical protein
MARERQQREAEERDRIEMKKRLDEWDDDASDEMFYVDRWVHYLQRFFFSLVSITRSFHPEPALPPSLCPSSPSPSPYLSIHSSHLFLLAC